MQWTSVLISKTLLAHDVCVCLEGPSGALPPGPRGGRFLISEVPLYWTSQAVELIPSLTALQRQQLYTRVQQTKHARKMLKRENERDGKENVFKRKKDVGRKRERGREREGGHRRSVARAVAPRRIVARVVSCVSM